MEIYIEIDNSYLRLKKILIILIIAGIIASAFGFGITKIIQAKSDSNSNLSPIFELATIQGNTLLPVSSPLDPIQPAQKIKMVITAYSSTSWETDDTPYITASGKFVREGTVANNMLPFGAEIRIPELYGEKVFVVEDRMHWRKGYYHLDIWFPSYWQAKDFGAKTTYVEVLES